MKIIDNRRSVRQFSSKKVEEEKIIKILKAAMQAPSAVNQQPWEFIVVESKDKIEELSKFSNHAKFAKEAPLLIVVLAKKTGLISENHMPQDLGACCQNLMLEAVDLGLGSTWMGTFPDPVRSQYIVDSLNINTDLAIPFALIAVGYPKKEGLNKFIDRYDETRIHREMY